ncbi:MAG: hypothetical protein M3N52_11940 [Actinomycetota bacterium]|nr:hypothetical protein [Actinomycetota bacterium]
MTLPSESNPPRYYRLARYYRLEVPAGHGWVTENRRGAWYVHHRLTRHWRHLTKTLAKQAKLPAMPGAHIVAELMFTTGHRRDPHNWFPTAKAAVDGLVDAGVLPDDRAELVTGPDMRLGPKVGQPCLVLHLWPTHQRTTVDRAGLP